MNGAVAMTWAEANQAQLAAEIACLRIRLQEAGEAAVDESERLLVEARGAMPFPSALENLAELLELSDFERQLLLLCCGVELDAGLAQCCALAKGTPGQANATFGLALSRLPDAHWSALTASRPLRRWHLLELEPGLRLVDSPLRIDERILHYVTGINAMDQRVRSLVSRHASPTLMSGSHAAQARMIEQHLTDEAHSGELLVIEGDDAQGCMDVFALVAERNGCLAFSLRSEDLPPSGADLDMLQALLEREARLLPALFLLHCTGSGQDGTTRRFCEGLRAPLFATGALPTSLHRPRHAWTVDKPSPREQRELWLSALGDNGTTLNGSLDGLASQFRLSATSIAGIAGTLTGSTEPAKDTAAGLWRACSRVGRGHLDDLAQRIDTTAGWDDLVLPTGPRNTLRQIAAHVRQRIRVQEEWGFGRHGHRGLGVSALFCGESGTGKTMAAEVLAGELGLDLYRIDLSAVVSKYIGETEKNLRRVFDAAEESGAVLLFDEADALFGKRSEVKDSHDRYANIEVSYLLQRMEAYRGLAVLTSNMKSALDRAFQRRLRFIITFPFPDCALREEIWRRSFPQQVPLDTIDYTKLARLNLPGGNIRNIALSAAFLAADLGEPLGMGHLLRAAQGESAKLERPLADTETRGWA